MDVKGSSHGTAIVWLERKKRPWSLPIVAGQKEAIPGTGVHALCPS